MPLQIRRGTEAERIAMVPKLANGELLWITDAKKLYVGDGVLASSVLAPVTGFNAEDAQDAAALLFTTTPTHSNITFAYDDLAGTLTATVNLSNYVGTIKASSFNGSLVADDSTTLVDAISGTFNGNLVGNVTGNTAGVHTGAVVGNVTGNTAGVHTGNVTGDVTGNTEGYHTGDVKGSVFGDDSTPLVDSVDRIFYGTIDTGDIVINTDSITSSTGLNMGTVPSPLSSLQFNSDFFTYRTVADSANGKFFTMAQSRGTLASPTAIQAGDELGGLLIRAYTSSSVSAVAGTIGFAVDPTAVISGGNFVKSIAFISASTDTGNAEANALILDSAGCVTSNGFAASKYFQLPVYADDAARLAAIPTPAKGMMVFMTTGTVPTATNNAVIYNGTTWVNV
jgi:hypothetical protein